MSQQEQKTHLGQETFIMLGAYSEPKDTSPGVQQIAEGVRQPLFFFPATLN